MKTKILRFVNSIVLNTPQNILSKDITLQELYEKEAEIIDELIQNIMVDIYEHN